MFTTPAIDAVGTGLIGRGHHDAWRSRVRGLPESAGELPVSVLREEIETPGEGQIRAVLTRRRQPGAVDARTAPASTRRSTDLDFMAAVDIYVNETTRHADVILPPTTALERDHYDLVFHLLAVRNTARFTPAVFEKAKDAAPRLGDLPRDHAAHHGTTRTARQPLRKRLVQRARLIASPTFLIGQLLRRGDSGVTLKKLRQRPGRHRPRSAARPASCPSGCRRRTSGSTSRPPSSWMTYADSLRQRRRPRESCVLIGRRHKQDCNSWMHNSERLTRGTPAPPAADEPRRPGRARARPTARGCESPRGSASVEVEVAATDDLMPGVVSLPHGYGHARDGVPDARSRDGRGRLDQRPHRSRAARRLGQRRAQRRTCAVTACRLSARARSLARPRPRPAPAPPAGHQARSPSSTSIAGSITSRIRVASSRMATASPTPIIFISSMRQRGEDREHRHHHGRCAGHHAGRVGDALLARPAARAARVVRALGPG